ncbi:hypothetical protein PG996_002320 [Apiospora saccharicola]|uniref:Enoyl reductase (ER) domain-containing protein n=1 Tax=Apiospora saccharicola TaxID=335842 RepID=A0ABR1WN51_9PEZI
MATPTTIKAIVAVEKGKAEVRNVAMPKLRNDYVLVKVKAVGLNPTDWKHVDFGLAPPGARVGCDYAGVVEEVGPAVTKDFRKGDRIAGVVHGCDATQLENGAFAEYIVGKGDLQIKIPDNLSDEEAATLGISVCTVGQGLYRSLQLPLPPASFLVKQRILIYGGSTATGLLGIQFARLSGLAVLTTSSPHNFELLRSLGARWTFDYNAGPESCAADIRRATSGSLPLAWDCTGLGAEVCAAALSTEAERDQPTYGTIMPIERAVLVRVNPAVRGPRETLMYTVFGERFVKGGKETPADPEEYAFAKEFWELARRLLESGDVKAVTPDVNRGGKGGLDGVLVGLDELRAGKVSGTKLVYTL